MPTVSKVYRIGEFAARVGRTASTVRRWEAEGRITAKRTASGQRYFTEDDVREALRAPGVDPSERETVVYCRVSSPSQKPDLGSQVQAMETFTGRKSLGRNMNRRLAAWTKGITAQALTDVSERRSSALRLVNAAYTSQVDPRTGLLAVRAGDRLHLPGGVVMQADHAAAINILARDTDPDIGLRTPYRRVREILQERADRQRTRLPVQDSNPHPWVESETSNPYLHASVGS
jgi:DNA-binding transcriptional MerR regulator